MNTLWGSSVAITAVSLSGDVTRLTHPAESCAVLATTPSRVYAAGSSLAKLPSVSALDLPVAGDEGIAFSPEVQAQWVSAGDILRGLDFPEDVTDLLKDISVTRRISGGLLSFLSELLWVQQLL